MTRTFLFLFVFLSGCASATLSTQEQAQVDIVSAASFLGDEFLRNAGPRTIFVQHGQKVDVAAWKLDAFFQDLLAEGVKARGKEFRALNLDAAELEKALGLRETRWKKTRGKYNQALLDLLLRQADSQGVHFLFMAYPLESLERFPSLRGPLGAACGGENRAYVYFEFDFSLWDVKEKKKIFQGTVDPSITEQLTFATCQAAEKLEDPAQQLEDPTKKTLGLLVDALFEKMGWKKAP